MPRGIACPCPLLSPLLAGPRSPTQEEEEVFGNYRPPQSQAASETRENSRRTRKDNAIAAEKRRISERFSTLVLERNDWWCNTVFNNCRCNEIYGKKKKTWTRLLSPPRPFPWLSFSLCSLASLFAQRKILISLQDGITRKNSCSGNRSSVHLVLMIETVSFRNRWTYSLFFGIWIRDWVKNCARCVILRGGEGEEWILHDTCNLLRVKNWSMFWDAD